MSLWLVALFILQPVSGADDSVLREDAKNASAVYANCLRHTATPLVRAQEITDAEFEAELRSNCENERAVLVEAGARFMAFDGVRPAEEARSAAETSTDGMLRLLVTQYRLYLETGDWLTREQIAERNGDTSPAVTDEALELAHEHYATCLAVAALTLVRSGQSDVGVVASELASECTAKREILLETTARYVSQAGGITSVAEERGPAEQAADRLVRSIARTSVEPVTDARAADDE